ncbi:MAG: DNA mismatch repair protein MutS [Armatimonadetes bacterium]|nr:DNA mismatch repair protein MutS [Armatimonadota bacterium]
MSESVAQTAEEPIRPNTPLMKQYFGAREEHPGVILLMRVGDFFEAYGPDAETIASDLNITLTSREDGGQRLAMAGVPHHAAERYIARLLRIGRRVALMDQVEDPKLAKGLVKRRVTRVVSKGTVFDDALLDAKTNNYLVAAVVAEPVAGIGVVDVTTGEFLTTEFAGECRTDDMVEEILRLEPAEILAPDGNPELVEALRAATSAPVTVYSPKDMPSSRTSRSVLTRHFGTSTLRGFGCEDYTAGLDAAALIIDYLGETHVGALAHINTLGTYSTRQFMGLDAVARRNLEVSASLVDGSRARTLLGVLDSTLTPMGARLLRRRIEEPLLDVERIRERLDAQEEFVRSEVVRGDVRDLLRHVNDVERLVARASAGLANARDLVALRTSLDRLDPISQLLAGSSAVLNKRIAARIQADTGHADEEALLLRETPIPPASVSAIRDLIARAIVDDPPAGVREGGLIRPGHSVELDALRQLCADGRAWIANLEASERTRTGIGSLKVCYSAVFGYTIEVTKPNLGKAPPEYIRRQTTANGERFITPELKEQESRVLGADEKAIDLEYRLLVEVRERVADSASGLLDIARALAELDCTSALAEVAARRGYVRPIVDDSEVIDIRGGRHPVVERIQERGAFVPNDCRLDCNDSSLHVITGPNMSGKSTLLRQVALIALMAQMGSYVPADSARIGIVDRVFTRVGAHDELATGQSTFMVEMTETAAILNNATRRSLVILDEIGRGTSTYDGVSIAWAVAEHLAEIGCRTLFATHYHLLNDMAKRRPNVHNFPIAVREQGDGIVFLHRLVTGGTDRSYGIHVARMAGIPPPVVERAREILRGLERNGAGKDTVGQASRRQSQVESEAAVQEKRKRIQLTLFELEENPVIEELRSIDTTTITPIEALVKLSDLQRRSAGAQ